MMEQLYCCKCERTTTHRLVDDEVFGKGWKCLACKTVWEADSSPVETNEPDALVVRFNDKFDKAFIAEKYGDKDDI